MGISGHMQQTVESVGYYANALDLHNNPTTGHRVQRSVDTGGRERERELGKPL